MPNDIIPYKQKTSPHIVKVLNNNDNLYDKISLYKVKRWFAMRFVAIRNKCLQIGANKLKVKFDKNTIIDEYIKSLECFNEVIRLIVNNLAWIDIIRSRKI